MPGGTGRCTETAVRGYSGNGGAKRGSGGTRPRLDAQEVSEAITWFEEAQIITAAVAVVPKDKANSDRHSSEGKSIGNQPSS